jgi:nitrate reductase delta subunit
MITFKVLAALLNYPEQDLRDALGELETALGMEAEHNDGALVRLSGLFALLKEESLIALQENYVATFDRNPSHSLHLFEHVHGESRDRGSAMVNLMEEYRNHGLVIDVSELPDFVPLFLEYLSTLPREEALHMLGEAIHVLALIGKRLEINGSAYHEVFAVLVALSPVEAQEIEVEPVRDMEETMVSFGGLPDGSEPLLTPKPQIATISMPQSTRRPAQAAGGH